MLSEFPYNNTLTMTITVGKFRDFSEYMSLLLLISLDLTSYCKTFLNHLKPYKGEVKAVSESALKESPVVPVGLAACALPPNYD